MIIAIDVQELNVVKLSIEGFVICYMIFNNRKDQIIDYVHAQGQFPLQTIIKLQENGWLKIKKTDLSEIYFEDLEITEKFRIFVENKTQKLNLTIDWVDDWFDMFPKGQKSGGYYIKSDLSGCKKKMKRFMARHQEYSKDIIMQATKNYIERCRQNGYQYMKIAPYFIEKDNVSMLAGECQAILDHTDQYNNTSIQQI